MAALKLITLRISWSSDIERCHCTSPFSQAEMAASNLVTLGDDPSMRTSLNNDAIRCHCSPFLQAEMAVLKLIT
eukprot:8787260-Karenia_brevis.AAC.1